MAKIHRHTFTGEGRFNESSLEAFHNAMLAAFADEEAQVLLL